MYTCPVCGYDRLELPPANYAICPVCATEFRHHDAYFSHAQLRQRWIAVGAQWWDLDTPQPPGWSPEKQLRNIGYELTDDDRRAIAQHQAAA